MRRFAFLVHPMSLSDVYRKYSFARKVNPKLVKGVLRRRRPFVVGTMEGIVSATGEQAEGLIVVVPFLPEQFYSIAEEKVVRKIARAVEVAAEEGAEIVGLGAHTAIPGRNGLDLRDIVPVPVTTGNTYTVAIAIESILKGLEVMEADPATSTLAVFGATGSIGRTVSLALAPRFQRTVLIGRSVERLEAVADEARANGAPEVTVSTRAEDVREAKAVVTVSGAIEASIYPDMLAPGAVVCDVARPRDVSEAVSRARRDVLVIDGGIVDVPGRFRTTFDIGLPRGRALACMAETMILALEGRREFYTLGKDIPLAKVEEMNAMAAKHGFRLGGFRSFERELAAAEIERIRQLARASAVT